MGIEWVSGKTGEESGDGGSRDDNASSMLGMSSGERPVFGSKKKGHIAWTTRHWLRNWCSEKSDVDEKSCTRFEIIRDDADHIVKIAAAAGTPVMCACIRLKNCCSEIADESSLYHSFPRMLIGMLERLHCRTKALCIAQASRAIKFSTTCARAHLNSRG